MVRSEELEKGRGHDHPVPGSRDCRRGYYRRSYRRRRRVLGDVFAYQHFDAELKSDDLRLRTSWHFDAELKCGLLYLRNSCLLHDQRAAGAMPPVWYAGRG